MLTRLRTRLVFFSSLFCHLYHVQCIHYITIIVYIKLLINSSTFSNLNYPLGPICITLTAAVAVHFSSRKKKLLKVALNATPVVFRS